jgi:Zn-dependent metalloprotease
MGLFASSQAQVLTGAAASKKVAGADMIRISDHTGNIDYVQLIPAAEVELSKSEAWLKQVFHLGSESSWVLIGNEKDQLGGLHYRYQQLWNGVPIRDAIFILHTRNGKIFSVNGTLYPELHILNQPAMDQSAALTYAINYVGASEYMWDNPAEENVLKQMTKDPAATYRPTGKLVIAFDKTTKGYYYTWCFDIYAKAPLSRQDVYVDASNGTIRLVLGKLYTTDVVGSAVTKYSGTQPITTDNSIAGSYRLRETGRGDGIETYDMNQGTNYGLSLIHISEPTRPY